MKRAAASLALAMLGAAALCAGAGAAELDQYRIVSASASLSTNQAGAHADFTTTFQLSDDAGDPYAMTRDVVVKLPAGLFGNPLPFPTCTNLQLGTVPEESECPIDSQVGSSEITLGGVQAGTFTEPIYNMADPPPGVAARFGFFAGPYPAAIDVRLGPDDHRLVATVESAPAAAAFVGATTTFWGVPAAAAHDIDRITPEEAVGGAPPEGRPSGLPEVPFMTNPTSCESGREVEITATSYALPGSPQTKTAPFPEIAGCSLVGFEPEASVSPTTEQAASGTGLRYTLTLPDKGLRFPNLRYGSELKRAEVTLPEGMTLNPSQAEGLGVCSEADLARERYDSGPGEGCPESSKVGNLTATTPVLAETASGSLYVAKPYENPFGSLVAIYLVLRVPERGVIVKLAGEVRPDPGTGQLITSFDDVPELPVTSFDLRFREGARAPLITPPACGSFQTDSRFTPHSAPGSETGRESPFEITSGPDHSACPAGGARPFAPGFEAGSLNNQAGAYSPFLMRLTRKDGEQDLTRFAAVLPEGVLGKVAGVPRCPEAAIARAKARTGAHGAAEELADPSCPAASRIGRTTAGAGVGSTLTYVGGSLYLSGPYNGAPLSVVSITPAKAGPFDAGTVVVRVALSLDPITARVEVDGSASDPIPHILQGIPLSLRDLRVYAERPEFTRNPTDCSEGQTLATLWGGGTIFDPSGEAPVGLAARYQAADCAALGFKPRLAIKLNGGVRRGAHPALKAVVTPRPGDANFSRAAVTLPRSAFLDQAHIRTVCTRVQFAAGPGNGALCPQGAQYGYARAWSPLLDGPAQGPVFLRSSDNKLPDLVAALKGPPSAPFEVELSARIDSVRGGIRSTFAAIPDVPVSRFVLDMQGAKKGLIVNSRHLCHKPARNRARANLKGQNGRLSRTKPRVVATTCQKHRKAKRARARRSTGRVSRASAVGG